MKQYGTLSYSEMVANNQAVNNEMLQLANELNEKMTRFVELCSIYETPIGRFGDEYIEYIEELHEVMNEEVIKRVKEVTDNATIISQMSEENNLFV